MAVKIKSEGQVVNKQAFITREGIGPLKNVVKKGMKVIGILFIGFAVLEIFSRLFLNSPSRQIYDAELGYRYSPNSMLLSTKEGFARNHINRYGFNGPDTPGVGRQYKVMVLGDSYTEALQVPAERNFCSLLDAAFPRFQFFNFARAGLSPVQYSTIADRFYPLVKPDRLFLVLTDGDIEDILAPNITVQKDENGNIVRVESAALEKDKTRGKLQAITSKSALATYLLRKYKNKLQEIAAGPVKIAVPARVYGPAEIREARSRLLFVVKSLRKRQRLVAVYIPKMVVIDKNTLSPKNTDRALIYKTVSNEAGCLFADTTPFFIENFRKTHQVPFGFFNSAFGLGHLNETGHAVVAAAVAAECAAELN